uniref:Uncharacterized protein n=1 Tax=Timema genevievae TaxID=629358 RepID=A0A7R9K0W1_TIMGE|nr:unnamed protein product [Timema genevievae]
MIAGSKLPNSSTMDIVPNKLAKKSVGRGSDEIHFVVTLGQRQNRVIRQWPWEHLTAEPDLRQGCKLIASRKSSSERGFVSPFGATLSGDISVSGSRTDSCTNYHRVPPESSTSSVHVTRVLCGEGYHLYHYTATQWAPIFYQIVLIPTDTVCSLTRFWSTYHCLCDREWGIIVTTPLHTMRHTCGVTSKH